MGKWRERSSRQAEPNQVIKTAVAEFTLISCRYLATVTHETYRQTSVAAPKNRLGRERSVSPQCRMPHDRARTRTYSLLLARSPVGRATMTARKPVAKDGGRRRTERTNEQRSSSSDRADIAGPAAAAASNTLHTEMVRDARTRLHEFLFLPVLFFRPSVINHNECTQFGNIGPH